MLVFTTRISKAAGFELQDFELCFIMPVIIIQYTFVMCLDFEIKSLLFDFKNMVQLFVKVEIIVMVIIAEIMKVMAT